MGRAQESRGAGMSPSWELDADIAIAATDCEAKYGPERAKRWARAQQDARDELKSKAERDRIETERSQLRLKQEQLRNAERLRQRALQLGLPEDSTEDAIGDHVGALARFSARTMTYPEFKAWFKTLDEYAYRQCRRFWLLNTRDLRKKALRERRGECPTCKQILPPPNARRSNAVIHEDDGEPA